MNSPTERLPTHIAPIDKNAKKEILVSEWASERFTMKECPPLCEVPIEEIQKRVSNPRRGTGKFRDLTGQRNGRMVIVGLRQYRERRRSSWTAQCDCGNFEQRNHRNWQKYLRKGIPDACGVCMPTELRIATISAILDSDKGCNENPS